MAKNGKLYITLYIKSAMAAQKKASGEVIDFV